jgi:uncharacterized protein
VQAKVREALIKARLYGSAGIVIGTQRGDTAQPLEPERIGEGGLLFLHVVTRHELAADQSRMTSHHPTSASRDRTQ